jgi:hypothetical protein
LRRNKSPLIRWESDGYPHASFEGEVLFRILEASSNPAKSTVRRLSNTLNHGSQTLLLPDAHARHTRVLDLSLRQISIRYRAFLENGTIGH